MASVPIRPPPAITTTASIPSMPPPGGARQFLRHAGSAQSVVDEAGEPGRGRAQQRLPPSRLRLGGDRLLAERDVEDQPTALDAAHIGADVAQELVHRDVVGEELAAKVAEAAGAAPPRQGRRERPAQALAPVAVGPRCPGPPHPPPGRAPR